MATNWDEITQYFIDEVEKWKNGEIGKKPQYRTFAISRGLNPGTLKNQVSKRLKKLNYNVKKQITLKTKNNSSKSNKGQKVQESQTLNKHDWNRYKSVFIYGSFLSLSAFAKHIGMSDQSINFKTHTKGWIEAKLRYLQKEKHNSLNRYKAIDFISVHSEVHAILNDIRLKSTIVVNTPIIVTNIKEQLTLLRSYQSFIEIQSTTCKAIEKALMEPTRKSLIKKFTNGEITIERLVFEYEYHGIHLPTIFLEIYKASLKEKPKDDWNNFNPAESEKEAEIADQGTKAKIISIKEGAAQFKVKRTEEDNAIKKDLAPNKDTLKPKDY